MANKNFAMNMRFSEEKQFVVRYIGKVLLTHFLSLEIQKPLASFGRLSNKDCHLAVKSSIFSDVFGLRNLSHVSTPCVYTINKGLTFSRNMSWENL